MRSWSLYRTEFGTGAVVAGGGGVARIILPLADELELEAELSANVAKDGGNGTEVSSNGAERATVDALEHRTEEDLKREPDDGLCRAIEEYFGGDPAALQDWDRASEGASLDLTGFSVFERRVFAVVRRIGHGQTRSYAEVAEQAGHKGAARAVGNALARNRFPIVVPCHRVIAADGSAGGWSGPPGLKEKMLEMEGVRCGSARAGRTRANRY